MSDHAIREHPDFDVLSNYIAGQLNEDQTKTTRKHVESCSVCQLEIKRMGRFEHIDSDTALREEAGWETAKLQLERGFREKVLPEVVEPALSEAPGRKAYRSKSFWGRWQLRWLAPAAAAAAVLLVIFQLDRTPVDDLGPMRGPTPEAAKISDLVPSGEIGQLPALFTWQSSRDNDHYTIEIFTSDLDKIYEASGIKDLQWATTDSLSSLLKRETLYLWSVTGYKGLERENVSPSGWFRVTTVDSSR